MFAELPVSTKIRLTRKSYICNDMTRGTSSFNIGSESFYLLGADAVQQSRLSDIMLIIFGEVSVGWDSVFISVLSG